MSSSYFIVFWLSLYEMWYINQSFKQIIFSNYDNPVNYIGPFIVTPVNISSTKQQHISQFKVQNKNKPNRLSSTIDVNTECVHF